jgi:CelD/BcsL family acetyltransferase involved in cellulose biosynthesis
MLQLDSRTILQTRVLDCAEDFATLRAYIDSRPDTTVYHLPQWRTIFRDGLGYRSISLLTSAADGTTIGCLTLYLVPGLLARRLVAVPFRDRGGPLWSSPEALDQLLARATSAARQEGAGVMTLKSLSEFPGQIAAQHGFLKHDHWIRSVVDLTKFNAAGYFTAIGPKTRNMIRQSERAGLELEIPAAPVENLADWHALHLATQQELGVPPFPFRFFAAMFRELAPTGHLYLFLVRRESKVLAASIVFRHGETAIYGYSASLPEGRQYRPNDFLLFNMINWSRAQNLRRFDMGSDSPSQESLLFFKRKWLAEQEPIPTYVRGAGPAALNDSSESKYARARALVRRLPRPVFGFLGRFVTPYFG